MSSSLVSATPKSGVAVASRSGKPTPSTTIVSAPACSAPAFACSAKACQANSSPAPESLR